MTFGSYNPGSRYRKRSQKRLTRSVFSISLFFIAFILGYSIGVLRGGQRVYIQQQENKTLNDQYGQIKAELTQARAEAQTANIRLQQVKASHDEILAEGPMQDMVLLIKKQLDAGVDPKRLESVVLSARPPQNCSEPASKRFLVITPTYQGPESKISLESGIISIWGKGESSRNTGNVVEAWFDPSKPVKIYFQAKGSEPKMKEGPLPLHYSVVIGAKEYRFTVAEDAKSFAKVTYDYCDFP